MGNAWASRHYPLRRGTADRLEVTWTPGYELVSARLDGHPLLTREHGDALRAGWSFQPDGWDEAVSLALRRDAWGQKLHAELGGRALPRSPGDLGVRVTTLAVVLHALGVFALIVAVMVPAFAWAVEVVSRRNVSYGAAEVVYFFASVIPGLGPSLLMTHGEGVAGAAATAFTVGLCWQGVALLVRARSRFALALVAAGGLVDPIVIVASARGRSEMFLLCTLLVRGVLLALAALAWPAVQVEEDWPDDPPLWVPVKTAETAAPAPAPPAPVVTPVPTNLSPAEAERRRLTVPGSGARPAFDSRHELEIAADGLRFRTRKVVIRNAGLDVTPPVGVPYRVAWSDVTSVSVRLMPPLPPWSSASLLDLGRRSGPPVRIFATTLVNFVDLGVPPASRRVDGLRALARYVRTVCPQVKLDPENADFVEGRAAQPPVLRNAEAFVAYDARFG